MVAVVEIAGQQFKVSEKGKYNVPRLKEEAETSVTFDNVLLLTDDKGLKKDFLFLAAQLFFYKYLS